MPAHCACPRLSRPDQAVGAALSPDVKTGTTYPPGLLLLCEQRRARPPRYGRFREFFLSQKLISRRAQRSRNEGGSGRGLGENGGLLLLLHDCGILEISCGAGVLHASAQAVPGTWVGVRGSPGCSRGSLLHAPLPKRFSRVGALTVRLSRLSVSFEAFLSPLDLRMHSLTHRVMD